MLACLVAAVMQGGLAMTTIDRGVVSDIDGPREVVARTADEWQALWKAHAGPARTVPPVDFAARMVVGVFAGTRNTGGYDVEITAVEVDGAGLVVRYAETSPAADALVAQVITSPFHVVSVPRTEGVVRFERSQRRGR